ADREVTLLNGGERAQQETIEVFRRELARLVNANARGHCAFSLCGWTEICERVRTVEDGPVEHGLDGVGMQPRRQRLLVNGAATAAWSGVGLRDARFAGRTEQRRSDFVCPREAIARAI